MTYWVWLIIAGVFAIIEVRSLAFYALFAAIGAAAASLASAVSGSGAIGVQVAVFAAVSLLGVVFAQAPRHGRVVRGQPAGPRIRGGRHSSDSTRPWCVR